MRMCANMHAINTTNYDIHTHIYARSTSSYDNVRLITYMFKLKNNRIREYTTICGEVTVNSWLFRIHFGQLPIFPF